jgi:hypothetical protein
MLRTRYLAEKHSPSGLDLFSVQEDQWMKRVPPSLNSWSVDFQQQKLYVAMEIF